METEQKLKLLQLTFIFQNNILLNTVDVLDDAHIHG
jgi:hypothetical protein